MIKRIINFFRRKNKESGYKFEDAYNIRGRGVGTLDLDRAMESKTFADKARGLAKRMAAFDYD